MSDTITLRYVSHMYSTLETYGLGRKSNMLESCVRFNNSRGCMSYAPWSNACL